MSGVGEMRQPGWRTAWHVAMWPARALHLLMGFALFGTAFGAIGAIGLAWRLAQGPLDVTWLVRAVETIRGEGEKARVTIGQASIAWNGFNGGAHSGLELRLTNLHAVNADGRSSAHVAQADVTLQALPLLSVTMVPRRVVLDGVQLRAVRGADGGLRLDADAPPGDDGLPDVLAELRRPAGNAEAEPTLAALQQVVIEHARLTVLDEVSGTSLQGDISDLKLQRRDGGGITGAGNGRFDVGGTALAFGMTAELLPDGGTHLAASLRPLSTRPVDTATLARIDPALAGFGTLDTTVEAYASLDLSPALRPMGATLRAKTGAGTLSVPDSAPVAFERTGLAATATWGADSWRPSAVNVTSAEFVLVGGGGRTSTGRITADANRDAGHWTVRTTAGFDRADFADLAALWPAAWGGHVRPWLTENVTAGSAHDAAFTATIDVPEADPARTKAIEAGGSMQADNVVIHWLRPVPPIEHAQATLTVTGPDDLVITVPRGTQGPIALSDGVLRFTGLSHKDQYLALTAAVQGAVPDVLKLLREKRLQLLDAHPLPITGSAGKAVAKLSVMVPMFEHLTFDQVAIASSGRLTGLRLNGLVGGRDLERGDVTYDVTQDGLKAAGTATVAGVTGQADVMMDFRSGDGTEITQKAHLVGRIGAAELAAHDISTAGVLTSGTALADVTYTEQRNGVAQVAVKADFAAAGLAVAGWRKAPGVPARAAATLLLGHGAVTAVPKLSATGPGLEVSARAEMVDGAPRVLRVERVVLGPTRLSGEVVFPAEPSGPVSIRATGPVLDLADQVRRLSGRGSDTGGRSWIVDVRFGRVLLGGGRTLTELAAHVEHSGGRLQALQATTGGAEQLRASITPAPNGRRLLVHAADTGSLLRGLDLTNVIHGGRLAVDASYDDRFADPPLEGRMQLGQFGVRDGVVLGKLLQAVTIYGVVDALHGEGVYFAEAQVPFCLCEKILRLGPSRASSASLGITAQGAIDLDRNTIAMTGTVVPAYVLNAALGKLPLVGRLFSAERGGGLIAAGFNVSGPMADPGVRVNPLSLLTPGILRQLFGIFG